MISSISSMLCEMGSDSISIPGSDHFRERIEELIGRRTMPKPKGRSRKEANRNQASLTPIQLRTFPRRTRRHRTGLNRRFGSGLGLVVDDRHLALPPVPGFVVINQLDHETRDVPPARLAGVEDSAADGGGINLILGVLLLVDQAIGTDHRSCADGSKRPRAVLRGANSERRVLGLVREASHNHKAFRKSTRTSESRRHETWGWLTAAQLAPCQLTDIMLALTVACS